MGVHIAHTGLCTPFLYEAIQMAIVDIKQRTDEWFAWRKQGITASMIPVILGESPYMTPYQLWAEAVGLKEPEDLSNNWHVQRGVAQEPEALAKVQERYGKLFVPCCIDSDTDSRFKASLDGLSIDGQKEVVEIKCPCETIYWEIVNQKTNSPAFRVYYGQVQWQMFVANTDKARLFFYLRGHQPICINVKRNDVYLEKAQKLALEFWNNIQTQTAPALTANDKVVYQIAPEQELSWNTHAAEYIEIERQYQQQKALLETLKSQLDSAKENLVSLLPADTRSLRKSGVTLTRSNKQGRINMARLDAFILEKGLKINLDDFRDESSTTYRVTTYDCDQPELSSTQAGGQQLPAQETVPVNETIAHAQVSETVEPVQTIAEQQSPQINDTVIPAIAPASFFASMTNSESSTESSITPVVDAASVQIEQTSVVHLQTATIDQEPQPVMVAAKVDAFVFF